MFNRKRILAIIGIALLIGLSACGNSGNETLYINGGSYHMADPPAYESPEYDTRYTHEEPELPDWGNYPIIINGVGTAYNFYVLEGEIFPTHVPLGPIAYALGLDVIGAGSQLLIQRDSEESIELSIVNYLAFGEDRDDVGPEDTFMAEDFNVYVPISVFRELGFGAYSSGGHVHINDYADDMH